MFRQSTLSLIVLLLLLALVLRQGLLVLLCLLLLLTAGLARLWSRWSLRRLKYHRTFSQRRAFVGDEIELTIRIENRKLLPLASLRVLDRIPNQLQLLTESKSGGGTRYRLLQRSTALRWYERVNWHYRLRCTARGAFKIGPVQLLSGDPFGLYGSSGEVGHSPTLIVYPQMLALEDLGLPARNPLGEIRAGMLFRDPLRIVGVRDYHMEDPLKDVHWAATARTGTLQTRIYEPTTARALAIFLDLDSFEFYYEGIDPIQVEHNISAAATLAHEGLAAGYAVGLYANGMPAEHEHLARLPPGRNPAQLELILETLARLTAYSVTPIARLMRLTAHHLPPGATLLLISSVGSERTRAALLRERERGRQVVWLYTGGEVAPAVPGIMVRHAPYTPGG